MLKKYTKEWLEELCLNSFSIAEVLRKAGRNANAGGNNSHVKTLIKKYNIDISHFTGKSWRKNLTELNPSIKQGIEKLKTPNEKLFIENSKSARSVVRRRIIKENIIDYKCSTCGNTGTWLDEELALELDHINGNNSDNRLINLRFLCPNCHAITSTYSGKNNKSKSGETGETQLA